jgi:hydrogenase/urease accessory protein HupE
MNRKTWNVIIRAVAGLAVSVAAALPASAHEGHHEQLPLAAALRHLLSEPDHQLAVAALVIVTVAGGWSWRRAKARR